jgi:hypothetical protein
MPKSGRAGSGVEIQRSDLILEGLGFKSTEASELEWKKEKATLAASR